MGDSLKRAAMMLGLVPAALSCINEDLSKCPTPCIDVTISYAVVQKDGTDPAFSHDVRSLHTGFWTSTGALHEESVLHEEDLPHDLTFAITLPRDNYDHLVTANCRETGEKHRLLPDNIKEATFELPLLAPDTVRAMSLPPFRGKLEMNLSEEEQTQYRVQLHPAAAKLELSLTHPATLSDIRCYVGGTKAGYRLWEESLLTNDKLITVATHLASPAGEGALSYEFYAFPTEEKAEKAAWKNLLRRETQAGQWKLYFLSHCSTTGKTIQHIFTIKEALYAGEVFRGKFAITEGGGEYNDVEAGIEVNPDWKPGGSSDVEI